MKEQEKKRGKSTILDINSDKDFNHITISNRDIKCIHIDKHLKCISVNK